MVVADRCRDRTVEIARGLGAEVVGSEHGLVGAARAAGVAHALRDQDARATWIASTDADSQVPVDWFDTHLAAAAAGVGLLLGTVRPDPTELVADTLAAWTARHRLGDGHPHIHGANMGVRGDVYRQAGGFPAVAEHEDAILASSPLLGIPVESTGRSPVVTSARLTGRTPAGLAGYLRTLMAETA